MAALDARPAPDRTNLRFKPGDHQQTNATGEADAHLAIVRDAANELRQIADRLDTYGAFSASASAAYYEHALRDLGRARDTAAEHAQLLVVMAFDTSLPIEMGRLGDALGVAHTTIRRWAREPRGATAT